VDLEKICSVCEKPFTKGKEKCQSCYMKIRYREKRDYLLAYQRKLKESDPVRFLQKKRDNRNARKITVNAAKVARRNGIRKKCLIHYGGESPTCSKCGENHIELLVLDHINGGGNKLGIHDLYEWTHARKFPTGFQVLCHNCNYVKGNGHTNATSKRPWVRRAKQLVMDHYGKCTCKCCRITDIDKLALDHLGDGAEHRRALGFQGGYRMYLWCIRNLFPPIFQILCHNCNFAKWAYGECVHTKSIAAV
jgi:hypothetical protein